MLMLQRAAENVNPSECNDPAVLLACSLGSDSCPAACQKDSEKTSEEDTASQGTIDGLPIAGDLSIAVADYSSSVKSAPAVGTVVFNAVDFKASEKVTIESVKLERTGLSDKSAIKGIWFEKDGIAVSAKASLTSDGTATTRFYNWYSVDGTDTLDLVVQLSGAAGSEIAFNIVGATSTARNVSANTTTTTYRTTLYTVATVEFSQSGGNGSGANAVTYKVGEKTTYEIGRFQISNDTKGTEDKDVVLKSLKLKNQGGLDMAAALKNVYVTKDSKTVSKRVELSSRDMTIYFDDDQIDSGKKGIYTIFAEVANLERPGDSVQLYLNKTSELVANEKSSNFRVAYKDPANASDYTLKEFIFNGGKVTFTTANNAPETVEAAPTSTDIEIAKGTLTVAEPVKFNSLTIKAKANSTTNQPAKVIKTLKVEIGGSTYTANDINSNNEYVINEEVYVSKTSDVRVLVNLTNETDPYTIEFDNINGQSLGQWEYENSSRTFTPSSVVAGSIQVAKLKNKAGKFYLTNKNSTNQKVVLGKSTEVTLFDGEINSNNGKVSVNDLFVRGNYTYTYYVTWAAENTKYDTIDDCTWAATDSTQENYCKNKQTGNGLQQWEQISLTLYVNGDPFSDAIYTKDYVQFSNLGDVDGSSMKIKLTAQPNISKKLGSIQFKVSWTGSDTQWNKVEANPVSAAKLEITAGAEISVANSAATSTAEIAGNNSEVVRFTATVKNGSKYLNSVTINQKANASPAITQLPEGTDVELTIDGKSTYQTSVTSAAAITFNDINETLEVGKHEFVVRANIDDSTVTKVEIVSVNPDKLTTVNVKKIFVKAYPVLSSPSVNTNNELVFTITNPNENEDVEIKWFVFADLDSVRTVSLNGISYATWDLTKNTTDKSYTLKDTATPVIISTKSSIEWRIQVIWTEGAQAVLNGIVVSVNGSDPFILTNEYTNVAWNKWADYKVTYKK